MYTPTENKKNPNVLTIAIDPLKVKRGHPTHRSGAGVHQDRRYRRNRTRASQLRASLKD
jgi:hypothetical protein